jgi:hypothetical protein
MTSHEGKRFWAEKLCIDVIAKGIYCTHNTLCPDPARPGTPPPPPTTCPPPAETINVMRGFRPELVAELLPFLVNHDLHLVLLPEEGQEAGTIQALKDFGAIPG